MLFLAILTGSVAVAVASIAALAIGLRGRRIDDHPLCRRCGFDLFNLPPTSTRCPECGADLARCRAIRVGHRTVRRWLLTGTLPLLLLSLGAIGFIGYGRQKHVDWDRHLPTWWLARETQNSVSARRDAALVELARRARVGQLSAEWEGILVDRALALQADLDDTWVPGWGDIVEFLHAAGRLSEDRWLRYGLQAITMELSVGRPDTRPCDSQWMSLSVGDYRAGTSRRNPLPPLAAALYIQRPWKLDKAEGSRLGRLEYTGYPSPERPSLEGLGVITRDNVGYASATLWDNSSNSPPLNVGDLTLQVTCVVRLVPDPNASGSGPDTLPPGPMDPRGLPYEREINLRADMTVHPNPRLNSDPALKPAMERAIRVEKIELQSRGSNGDTEVRIFGLLRCTALPTNLACTIRFRQPHMPNSSGETFHPYTLYVPRGDSDHTLEIDTFWCRVYGYPPRPGPCEVILDPFPGVTPFGLDEMWGETLIFKEVVKDAAAQPRVAEAAER